MNQKNLVKSILLITSLIISPLVFSQTQRTAAQVKFNQEKAEYKRYIPEKYDFVEAIKGDLNKDGISDTVLIVKATDPKAWVVHEFQGELDRNRRGIVVLFNQNGTYKKAVQNLSIFSSENEDGGVYFPPELWIEIKNNRLNIHYGHGRYGYWNYSFRHEANDFRLIGYDSASHMGPLLRSDTSVNLLTGKKRDRENLSQDEEQDPKFKESWTQVHYPPLYLSKIKDIDELDLE